MSKITGEQSREIYELATSTDRKMSNVEIGKKYGISERAVRHHIKKWEGKLHEISKTNEKAASAIANHAVNVHTEARDILTQVKASIREAKNNGVSPERLAPLYSNWIKSLELASELLGDINRAPQVSVHLSQQFNEFMKVILEEIDHDTKARITARIRPLAL